MVGGVGLACVLLIALWVRSYWRLDFICRCDSRHIMTTAGSQMGAFSIAHFDAAKAYKGTNNSDLSHGWEYTTHDAYAVKWDYWLKFGPSSMNVAAADWLPAIIVALVGRNLG